MSKEGEIQTIKRIMRTPYALGRGDLHGMDCWGLIELVFRYCHDIILQERGNIKPGPKGLSRGFKENSQDWFPTEREELQNFDIIILEGPNKRLGEHVGLYYEGNVIHTEDTKGCISEPLYSKWINIRYIQGLRHVKFSNR